MTLVAIGTSRRTTWRWIGACVAAMLGAVAVASPVIAEQSPESESRVNAPLGEPLPAGTATGTSAVAEGLRQQLMRTGPTVALFAVASLVPAAVLMVTAFVRISVVLTLLRQALGSPQVPGNQVLAALALLLTALVMEPVAEDVYRRGIEPFANGRSSPAEAWNAGTAPIKAFMVDQICRTHHQDYLWQLYDYSAERSTGRPDPVEAQEFPMRAVAPAFLLSELTTALTIGFCLYLPFVVVDLVVSAVLAAMGLFMLPPSLVALPLKLILFVLADGWMLVAGMLLKSFGGA
jgi:flagellar biosynthetic protein FliP